MFEYAVYTMDYEDAMTHLSFLKSLPKKNLRIFAHLYGMSLSNSSNPKWTVCRRKRRHRLQNEDSGCAKRT